MNALLGGRIHASRFRHGLAAVLAVAAVHAAGAAPQRARPVILRVDHYQQSNSAGNYETASHMPKFTDLYETTPREVFHVIWAAPEAGLPENVLVTFEYRQEYLANVRFLHIRYPFPVKGEKKAVFEVTGQARRTGGPVTAWRARVVYGGRLLAERVSENWSSPDHGRTER